MPHYQSILIIDDLELMRLQLKLLLADEYKIFEASSQKEALEILRSNDIQLVILDLLLPDVVELELLTKIRTDFPDVAVVIATVSDDPAMVVKCLKNGAKDYIFKDDLETNPLLLKESVRNILHSKQQQNWCDSRVKLTSQKETFIPNSQSYQRIYDLALRAVNGSLSLVILGETGVGKGTLVNYIHQKLMPNRPLVSVNCGAICHSIAEAELFGTERGAFTGAFETRKGKIEMANGGILFLDEIGNLSQDLQEKLLCALETKKVTRLGGTKEIQLDFTLISATNKDLETAVAAGQFRADLFYRIKQFEVRLPSLRENPDVTIEFADHYISKFNQKYGTSFQLKAPLRSQMLANAWIGNLRELKNEIQIMTWLHSQGEPYFPRWGTPTVPIHPTERTLNEQLSTIERAELQSALEHAQHNLAATARALNIHRSTLQGKLRKHGIYPEKSRR